jgi:hypothetical protein
MRYEVLMVITVVEILGFGAMWIYRSMLTFWRTCCLHLQGLRWQGKETEGGNVEMVCGPTGSLQAGYREGAV